jgi:hypothetical protein
MNVTASNIIGWALVLVISISGWVISNRATGKVALIAAEKAKETAKETASAEIKGITDALKVLPCVKSPNYEREYGSLLQQVKDLDKKVDQILENQKYGNEKK